MVGLLRRVLGRCGVRTRRRPLFAAAATGDFLVLRCLILPPRSFVALTGPQYLRDRPRQHAPPLSMRNFGRGGHALGSFAGSCKRQFRSGPSHRLVTPARGWRPIGSDPGFSSCPRPALARFGYSAVSIASRTAFATWSCRLGPDRSFVETKTRTGLAMQGDGPWQEVGTVDRIRRRHRNLPWSKSREYGLGCMRAITPSWRSVRLPQKRRFRASFRIPLLVPDKTGTRRAGADRKTRSHSASSSPDSLEPTRDFP